MAAGIATLVLTGATPNTSLTLRHDQRVARRTCGILNTAGTTRTGERRHGSAPGGITAQAADTAKRQTGGGSAGTTTGAAAAARHEKADAEIPTGAIPGKNGETETIDGTAHHHETPTGSITSGGMTTTLPK